MKKNPLSRFLAPLIAIGALAPFNALSQATYYNMATGDYSEDFTSITNTAVWVTPTTGSWQGLVVNTNGTIPSATRITTATTNFVTGSSGGAQRGPGNLQLLSTGSTNDTTSTAMDLLLNFSGRNAGNLSFQAAQVANATGNRVATLRAYYTTDSSTWAEIIGGGLPFIATNNVASSGTVNVALPAAINNASAVQIRFYYNNGTGGTTGSRPKISIDNVLVTSTPAAEGAPVITSGSTASAVANEASLNIYQIIASNSPSSFGATGLPSGLSIDTSTGIISGTATTPGIYTVGITAANAQGTGGATLTLTVSKNPLAPTITSLLTATGFSGTPFSYQIEASNTPTSYSATNLPEGLIINTTTGLISGTPTTGGTRSVTIAASNAFGSDSQTLALTINSLPTITSALSASSYTATAFTYQISAVGTPAVTSYGATGLPEGLTINSTTGAITGSPTAVGTTNVEITATNANGTTSATLVIVVLDQAAQNAIPLNVVVNKYANGSTSTPLVPVDKIQLLVIGNGTAGSSVDMRGMIVKDFSSSMGGDSGGKFVFTTNALWASVPAGTLIALSGGTTQTEDLDPSDYTLAVNLGNTTYFTASGSFEIATTEMVMIKAAGTGINGVAGGIHALAGGTAGAQFTGFTGAKLIASGTSAAGFGVIANNTTSALVDYGTSGAAASTLATGGVDNNALDFASWNNSANETYILSLRGSTPQNPYNTWAGGFGLDPAVTTGPTAGAPTADPDSDGFNNQQEYSFGTNPTQGTAALLSTESSGGNLIVRWLERAGVTYAPQSTANLGTTAFANDGTITVVAGPVEPAPPAGYTRKQFSVPATGNKFFRVRATTSP